MPTMSIFKAKETSTCVYQGLHFLQWCLSVATGIFKLGKKDVEIMINRPNKTELPRQRNFGLSVSWEYVPSGRYWLYFWTRRQNNM